MNPVLPTKDEWTTYDYDIGAKRMTDVKEGKYSFLKFKDFKCTGMPFIINFNDQMEYMRTHRTKVRSKLCVTGPDEFSAELKLLSKEKTIELATKSIGKWGKEYAEKVLSATETGSLYFHIVHYFGSYGKLLESLESATPSEGKRRKILDEVD